MNRTRLPVLALVAALAACHDHPEPAAPAPAAAADAHAHDGEVRIPADAAARYGLAVETAQRHVLQPTLHAPARVGFDTESMAHVGSPLRGRVAEVPVRVGDPVRVGQVLVVIESPDLGEAQAEYLQRRVAVQTAGPSVDLTQVAWERAKGLYERSQG